MVRSCCFFPHHADTQCRIVCNFCNKRVKNLKNSKGEKKKRYKKRINAPTQKLSNTKKFLSKKPAYVTFNNERKTCFFEKRTKIFYIVPNADVVTIFNRRGNGISPKSTVFEWGCDKNSTTRL